MTVRIFDTEAQVGQAAATLIAAQVLEKKNTILGLATGSSPIGCYQQLIAWHKQGILDFSECRSFNLDEYCALDPTHPCSYHQFMQDELFSAINMKATAVPDGCAADLNAECARYDAAIRAAGGIDLQLLGLGRNGHIGFNEPAACFTKGTNIVTLTQSTLDANKRFFNSISGGNLRRFSRDVPKLRERCERRVERAAGRGGNGQRLFENRPVFVRDFQ